MSERFEQIRADYAGPTVLAPGTAYGADELGPNDWGLQLGNPAGTALMVVGTRAELASMLQHALFLLVAAAANPPGPVRCCARCAQPITDPENAPAGDDALCVLCGDEGPCCWQLPVGRHSPSCPHRCWDCGGAVEGPDACDCGQAAAAGDRDDRTLPVPGRGHAPRAAVTFEQVR